MEGLLQFINDNLVICIVVLSALTAVICFFLIRAIIKLNKEAKKVTADKPKKADGYDELFSKPFWNENGDQASVTSHEQVENDDPKYKARNEKLEAKRKREEEKRLAAEEKKTRKQQAANAKLGEEEFRPIMRMVPEQPTDEDNQQTSDSSSQTEDYKTTLSEDNQSRPTIKSENKPEVDEKSPYSDPDNREDPTKNIQPMPEANPLNEKAPTTGIKDYTDNVDDKMTKAKFKIVRLTSGGFRFKLEGSKLYMVSGAYPDIPTITNAINSLTASLAYQDFEIIKTASSYKYVFKSNNKVIAASANFTDETVCKKEAKIVRTLVIK